ncbi:SO2930 family diheme c-type cytochrome [Caulobacter sp. NIBR2454]|uniref:SO2930 family diheme c-type cytochrome n=1 Tax=Caulobacter sp. NIBR2454 TaxID=3015996 RepID=UPI0022B5EA13|nr:SO2930 family diheme c-type cytochrome [Caulobacter sp. NIBR2454]
MSRLRVIVIAAVGLLALTAASPPAPVAADLLLAEAPAQTLDAYGLFTDAAARRPAAGVTPYDLNTPLFSDYAEKFRYVFVPAGRKVRYAAEGALEFPVGTALIKTFAYPADFRRPKEDIRFVETRLLIRKANGWVAQTYVWNAEQTKAVLKRAGARMDVSFIDAHGAAQTIDYAVPNTNQCKECHSTDNEIAPIGPKARNLNGEFDYGAAGDFGDAGDKSNQLAQWTKIGLLEGAPPPASIPATPRWDDPKAPLEGRARAYLDANCAHCHNPRGMASNSGLFLNLEERRANHLGIGKNPVAAGRGAGGLSVSIRPGDPDASILAYRMASREPGVMMPELGRSVVHQEGLDLVRAYIASMK